jgi:hypothetical protein
MYSSVFILDILDTVQSSFSSRVSSSLSRFRIRYRASKPSYGTEPKTIAVGGQVSSPYGQKLNVRGVPACDVDALYEQLGVDEDEKKAASIRGTAKDKCGGGENSSDIQT